MCSSVCQLVCWLVRQFVCSSARQSVRHFVMKSVLVLVLVLLIIIIIVIIAIKIIFIFIGITIVFFNDLFLVSFDVKVHGAPYSLIENSSYPPLPVLAVKMLTGIVTIM